MLLVTANIFQPLIDVFQAVIQFFHDSVGVPWGWAIVLLTVCVRALLVPLTLKQIGSMARLQMLQPEMKAIQAKYKEDKQRQQQEMMNFYKENKVNPLGSCLPMVAQLPVFISLYYMLRKNLRNDICPAIQDHFRATYAAAHHATLHQVAGLTTPCGNHGAGFLFIGDLTNNAHGITLIVLIVLYVGTQLASSLMMSAATTDPMQRRIMLFMPLVFVLFVIRFPAGVLVYWITTNTWTIGQQYIVKRRLGPIRAAHATAAAGASSSGGSGSLSPARALTPPKTPKAPRPTDAKTDGNGAVGGVAGLGARLRGITKQAEQEDTKVSASPSSGRPGASPPRPPRKKKKRSGRRR
jgi:YidC/Oxa1 family membrane protein insertase